MRMKPTNSNFNPQRNYILMIEEEIRNTWIYFKLWPFEKVINVLKKKRWSREARKRLTSGNHRNLCKVVREALPTAGWWMGKGLQKWWNESCLSLRKGVQTFLTCTLSLAQRKNIKRGLSNDGCFSCSVQSWGSCLSLVVNDGVITHLTSMQSAYLDSDNSILNI